MSVTRTTHRDAALGVSTRTGAQHERGAVARTVRYEDAPGYIHPGSDMAGTLSVVFAISLGLALWAGIFRLIGVL